MNEKLVRFLMTEEMREAKPESVRLLFEAENVRVVNNQGVYLADGSHVMADGDVDTLRTWLAPFTPIWHTKPGTAMQMEEFELVDVVTML